MSLPAEPLAEGRLVAGRYRLDQAIGAGGTSVVWSATHLISTRKVALKFLQPEKLNDAQAIARVYREARAASLPAHDGIVPIIDVFVAGGSPVLVMDLLEGESLRAKLDRDHTLSVGLTVQILVQVAEAVSAAHVAGVVHRDLKPENIFLVARPGAEPVARVLDFGIAKVLSADEQSRSLTSTGALLGTPYYMAPEQAFGEREIDHRVDIWSLGVVAYECLAGRRPTEAESLGQVLKILTHRDFLSLREAAPNVPPALSKVVDDMLQVDPKNRIATMAELSQRLRGDLSSRPSRMRFGIAVAASVLALAAAGAGFVSYRSHTRTAAASPAALPPSLSIVVPAPSISLAPALAPVRAEPLRPLPKSPAKVQPLPSAATAEPVRRPGSIVVAPPF